MKLIVSLLISFVLILSACTSSKEETKIQNQKYVSEKIPPGTAHVVAEIQTMKEDSSSYSLNVLIKKVNGYGQSTKPIAPNSSMKIDMRKNLITSDMEKDYLKVGSVYYFEISQPPKTMDGETNYNWQINSIKK